MYARRHELGGARLVCIVKEDLDGEIEAFERAAWAGGEILLDEDMGWFKAVGGGTVDKKSLAAWMVRALALPFTRAHANRRTARASRAISSARA